MYVVLCEFDDEAIRRAFEKWLLAGHLAEVSTFALTATLVRIDFSAAERPALEVHYTFRDRSEYERYLKEAAPRLRADSQERFPAGVRWQRRTGAVIHRLARSDS